ncbi:unnamed protein product [Sphagnum jensenii]|uniref:Uncharacterized protein n=1 Tax=Sphagnum jensenii TaxID=128206 RepID=A0ABP1B9I1_9BRYO
MSVMAAVLIAGSTKEKFLMPRLVESYKKILVIACEEASEWSMANPRLGVDLTYSNPSSLEEVLQKRVEVSNYKFKEMIQKAHTYPQTQGDQLRMLSELQNVGQETSPKLKHRYAQSSAHKCRISFLRRIKIIVDTEKLYTNLVKGTQFWGFLGTEDAGKSTFIKGNIK